MGKASRIRKARHADNELAAEMTRNQRRAVNREASRQAHDMTGKFFENEAAVILYALHNIFGFGKVRLKRFFVNYAKQHEELCRWYEVNAEDDGYDIASYLSKLQLQKIGVDFDAWCKEIQEGNK